MEHFKADARSLLLLTQHEQTPMTTFYLIRHASNDYLVQNKIAGWLPGIHLNDEGRKQADQLAERIGKEPIRAIYSSPIERAVETAEPLARKLGAKIAVSKSFGEVGFGDWTDQPVPLLDKSEHWKRWNSFRSGTQPPKGEFMIEIQSRAVREMLRLRDQHPQEAIAVVTHGDIIKAAAAYFLGVPLDLFLRIDISPASVSIISIDEQGPRILRLNG